MIYTYIITDTEGRRVNGGNKRYTEEIQRRTKPGEERNRGRFHTPENLAKPISIEAGELLECFRCNNEYDREAFCDETADVMLYCIMLADAIDADLKTELLRKIKKNGENILQTGAEAAAPNTMSCSSIYMQRRML